MDPFGVCALSFSFFFFAFLSFFSLVSFSLSFSLSFLFLRNAMKWHKVLDLGQNVANWCAVVSIVVSIPIQCYTVIQYNYETKEYLYSIYLLYFLEKSLQHQCRTLRVDETGTSQHADT